MSRWDGVSITAYCTAQIWAANGLPEAARFDTRRGRALYALAEPLFAIAKALGVTSPPEFCIQRHLVIDALVARRAPAQLVELACGLSPRCLAHARAAGVRCVDVDLPALLRAKARLAGADLPPSYRAAALDLVASADYAAELAGVLARGVPTVVIAEGLLSYLPLSAQQQLFARVAALLAACGGGTFLADVHHQQDVDRLGAVGLLFRAGLGVLTRTRPERMIEDFAHGEQLLRQAGFAAVTEHRPEDWAAALGLPLRARASGMRVYEARI